MPVRNKRINGHIIRPCKTCGKIVPAKITDTNEEYEREEEIRHKKNDEIHYRRKLVGELISAPAAFVFDILNEVNDSLEELYCHNNGYDDHYYEKYKEEHKEDKLKYAYDDAGGACLGKKFR